jgi:hypothetical protein
MTASTTAIQAPATMRSVLCAVRLPVRPTNVDHNAAPTNALLTDVAQGAECQLMGLSGDRRAATVIDGKIRPALLCTAHPIIRTW